jgi:hypothetical protein
MRETSLPQPNPWVRIASRQNLGAQRGPRGGWLHRDPDYKAIYMIAASWDIIPLRPAPFRKV